MARGASSDGTGRKQRRHRAQAAMARGASSSAYSHPAVPSRRGASVACDTSRSRSRVTNTRRLRQPSSHLVDGRMYRHDAWFDITYAENSTSLAITTRSLGHADQNRHASMSNRTSTDNSTSLHVHPASHHLAHTIVWSGQGRTYRAKRASVRPVTCCTKARSSWDTRSMATLSTANESASTVLLCSEWA